jgi:hypothetical protein
MEGALFMSLLIPLSLMGLFLLTVLGEGLPSPMINFMEAAAQAGAFILKPALFQALAASALMAEWAAIALLAIMMAEGALAGG